MEMPTDDCHHDRTVPDETVLLDAAAALLAELDRNGMTVATAESCTGGFLTSLLTDVEGLSHCVDRGHIVYSDAAKFAMLGISPGLIEQHGAVSEPVARAMAENSLNIAGSGLALAITGFAGPGGGNDESGLTFVGAAIPQQSWVHRIDYGDRPRRDVRNLACLAALTIGLRSVSVSCAAHRKARAPGVEIAR